MHLIYTTYPNKKTAEKTTSSLLKKKLIACATLIQCQSHYLWKGKIKNNREVISFIKTKKENFKKVEKEIRALHPYKIPCIIQLPAKANQEYENWIKKETKR